LTLLNAWFGVRVCYDVDMDKEVDPGAVGAAGAAGGLAVYGHRP
jgi:hypothetical protein